MNFDCNTCEVSVAAVDVCPPLEELVSDCEEEVGKFCPKYVTQSLGLK